jgi:hypothetical protein
MKLDEVKYLQPLMSLSLSPLANYLRGTYSASNSTAISSASFLEY